jgi:type IV pilus assembly protein PilM
MAKPFGVWGIDIGQCALKALRLEMIDGKPTATAFDFIEHPKILSQPDADPESLTREALEKFFSRNPIGKDEIAISIPGQSGLVRFVKLPPVEEKKVPDIVKFEAKQQIPFPLEEVVWDFQKIGGGETVGGFAMETEIGLFAMKRDIISKYLGQYNGTNAEIHYVQMAPLALCNFATYELLKKGGADGIAGDAPVEGEDETPRGKKRCAVVLDIGTDNSNLIITDGGKIIWQRNVGLGGSHFTRALTKEMKLTFAKAEHLKRNAAKSPDLAQILKALRPVLTEFVGEVQRSLGFFTNTHRDAHIAYLVGLGSAFKLPGLQKYLAEKLSLDVRKPSKITRLAGDQVLNDPSFNENVLTFPIAYGLALQGIGEARLKTNLLPGEVRTDRLIRAKKPAVAAATAAFLFGTAILGLGMGTQLTAVTDSTITAAGEKGKSAIGLAKAQDTEFNSKKSGIETGQNEIKAIVVGNDERLNWIRMQEVLTTALPRHGYIEKDGRDLGNSNLTEKFRTPGGKDVDQSTFWNTTEGRRAFEKYRERLSSGIPLEKLFDDDQSQYLAQVNVETVYCRYVTDLNAYYTAADKYSKDRFVVDIADDMLEAEVENDEANKRKKPKTLEGGGWVFEVRGYTMHHETSNFVRRALLRNLQRFSQFATLNDPKKRVEMVIPGAADPITPEEAGEVKKDRVSHAFVLLSQPSRNPTSTDYSYINVSYTDMLLGGGGGSSGGPGGPGVPGGPGRGGSGSPGGPGGEGGMPTGGEASGAGAAAAAPPWAPLGGTASAAGGGGGLGGMSTGGEGLGSFGGPGSPGGPGGMSVAGPGGPGGPAAPPTTAGKKTKPRTEFVVCFVWREPTPTDPTPVAGTP